MSRLRQLATKYAEETRHSNAQVDSADNRTLSTVDKKLKGGVFSSLYQKRSSGQFLSIQPRSSGQLNSQSSQCTAQVDSVDTVDTGSLSNSNNNNNIYIKDLERDGRTVHVGQSEARRQPASASDYRAALAAFNQNRPRGTRLRHDQACWAAEMFLSEWSGLAAEFEWTAGDIFDPPDADRSGLAYWLGTDIVTALGPEWAVNC
jgi:hypothetical protein